MAIVSVSPSGNTTATAEEALMESVSTLTQGTGCVLGEMMQQGDHSQAAQLISAVAGVLNGLVPESSSSTDESSSGETNSGTDSSGALKEVGKPVYTFFTSRNCNTHHIENV